MDYINLNKLPLSKRMIPKNFDEFMGQSELLSKGKPPFIKYRLCKSFPFEL